MSQFSMTQSRHIEWEQLYERIKSGIPFVHRIPSTNGVTPAIDIRVAERGEELALWIPCVEQGETVISPLEELNIGVIQTSAGRVIEIKTSVPALYQEVYSFFVSIGDKVQLNGTNPFAALEETLEGWRELLKARMILSEEAQLGLRGELYFLRRLAKLIGDDALLAWTGPQRQAHDFRVGETEFEVKTTRGATHTHIINGLGQLEPSPKHKLYIFSLRLSLAGAKAGSTLPDDIEETRRSLLPVAQLHFDNILNKYFSYKKEHAACYPQRLQLADIPRLIPVDSLCPRITNPLLLTLPHRARISDVRYRANFEGLGHVDGSPEFETILPHTFAVN